MKGMRTKSIKKYFRNYRPCLAKACVHIPEKCSPKCKSWEFRRQCWGSWSWSTSHAILVLLFQLSKLFSRCKSERNEKSQDMSLQNASNGERWAYLQLGNYSGQLLHLQKCFHSSHDDGWYRGMLGFHTSLNVKASPIRNLASIICQYISSKSVELEKYMRLQEMIEKMLMRTRVNFLPSWSNTVAERIPPNGHTKVFIEADKEANDSWINEPLQV